MSFIEQSVYAALTPLAALWSSAMQRALGSATEKARSGPAVAEMLEERPDAGVPTPFRVAPDLELDYLQHRSAAYVKMMVWNSARQFSAYVAGTNAPAPYTDADLARAVLSMATVVCTHRDEALGAWVFELSVMQLPMHQMPFYNADQMEVTRFVFDIEGGRFEIHDVKGRVHVPGAPRWLGARTKLIAQICVQVLAVHTWTHFWLPDVIAAKVHEDLPRETNLYRLLAPHTRFTNRHNHAGLWIQKASDNAPTLGKKLVPWLTVPAYKAELRGIFTDAAKRYYTTANHFDLPERMDRRMPYWDFLGAYWEVTRSFIERLAPSIERDVYDQWARAVDRWFPGFSEVPMERALAIIVWQMGIAHGVEHQSFVKWGTAVGCTDFSRTIDENPDGHVNGYERYRFLTFIGSFVDYQPPPSGLDLRLLTSAEAYGFPAGGPAEAAALQFKRDLVETDQRLQREGRALLPLDILIRTICF